MCDKLNKLLAVAFICEVKYPTYFTNMVIAPKKNRKWMICVDYTNLNKACLKDSYLLPQID